MVSVGESPFNRPLMSRPCGPTRIGGVRLRGNSKHTQEGEEQNNSAGDSHYCRGVESETLDDSENSAGFVSIDSSERPNHLENEINSLNHRLISYVDRVKQNETLLLTAGTERTTSPEQLEKNGENQDRKLEILRFELDEHARRAVLFEKKQARLEKKVQNLREKRKTLREELAARTRREAGLERELLCERMEAREARNKISQLQNRIERGGEIKREAVDELTKLKVGYAKLQERMEIANTERTTRESEASKAGQGLRFTSEDVERKLEEQRTQLEKLQLKNIDGIRQQYQAELASLRIKHQADEQKASMTYVSAEDYAALYTQMEDHSRRLQEAESKLSDREEKLRVAEDRIASLTTQYEKALAKERKRRERLRSKLAEQDENHSEILKELGKYRELIRGFDVSDTVSLNTTLGAKRARSSTEIASSADAQLEIPKGPGTPLIEAREVLARRVRTPLRKVPTAPPETIKEEKPADTVGSKRNCRMM